MIKAIQNLKWHEAVPRMVADLLVVHLSMVAAMAVSVVYQTARGNGREAQAVVSGFMGYYVSFFWLSPGFLLVFLLCGFYTHSRSYAGPYKTWAILRGVGLALLLHFGVNFLLFGREQVGRSVVLPFSLLAGLGLAGMRLLKRAFDQLYEVTPRLEAAPPAREGRVLVVGGAGYIGSLLVERLLEEGRKVRVLDNLIYGPEPLAGALGHPNLELQVGDCRNIQDVVRAVRGVDAIVDLAAIVGDPACEQDHQAALEVNYAATRMLIEIARGNPAMRFVFASSCSVYGASDVLMDEKSKTHPISLYAQTKVDSEKALLEAASESFHPTVLRFATVFGLSARPRFDLVVNLLAAKAHQEGVITIFNGQQWRPFIHVRDLVESIVKTLEAPAALVGGEIFNVGDVRLNHTLGEVAEKISARFPNLRVEHVENSDRRNYRVNFDKIRYRLGFQCRLSLEDGVAELKRAFEDGRIADYTDLRYHNQRFLKAAGSPGHKNELDAALMAAFVGPPATVH